MALDIEFPSPEEEFDKFRGRMNVSSGVAPTGIAPPMNIEFPEKVKNAFGEIDFQPFEKPYDAPHLKPEETPGFFASAAHEFKEDEVIAHGLNFAYDKYQKHNATDAPQNIESQNPSDETIPKNWTAYEPNNFVGYNEQYWPYLGNSESPSELHNRQQEVLKIQKEEEYYQDGSTWGKVAGGLGALAADAPIFALIPMAGAMKYSKFGAQVVKNVLRQSPGLVAGAVAYTAAIDSTTTGKTMSDFAWDATVNSLAGVALVGGAAGLGHLVSGGEMYAARHALKMNFEGIDIKRVYNKKGQLVDSVAVPTPNSAASAMEVTRAQEFLDSKFAKKGLFKVPYLGTGLEKAFKPFSPILRGLSSDWLTTNALTNRLAEHSIEVQGETALRARPENFESMMKDFHIQGIQMGQRIEGYRNMANGVGGEGLVAGSKRLKQRITEGPAYDKDTWGQMVMSHLFTGEQSEIPEVNSLGAELKDYYKKILNDYQRAHGLEEKDLPVKTAAAYLSRRYDVDYMIANESAWNDMALNWFREGDETISQVTYGVNEAKSRVSEIKDAIHNSMDVENNRLALREAIKAHNRERERLREAVRNSPDLHIHLEEAYNLSKQDVSFLKGKLKPWKESKKILKQRRAELTLTKNKLEAAKGRFETGEAIINPQPKDYAAIKKEIRELESEVKRIQKEVSVSEKNAMNDKQRLREEALDGVIPERMFVRHPESGEIKFKNPTAMPKFRKLFEDEGAMLDAAKANYNSITQTSADKIAQQMMDTFHGGMTGNPLPLKARSFMIPDQMLLDNNFLSRDLTRNAQMYANNLGRKTSLKNALRGFGVGADGIHGVAEELAKEYQKKKQALSGLPKDKFDKAVHKLTRSFKKEKDFITAMHKVAEGTYSRTIDSDTVRNIVNSIRSFTASTRLGNVPLAQLPDLTAGIYKVGPWKYFRDGLIPAIETMNGRMRTKAGQNWRESASTAGLCLEGVIHSKTDQLWNYATQSTETFSGKVANGLGYAAKKASTYSGADAIENFNQAMVANISQSNIISNMYKFQNGTLAAKETRKLAQFGLDPKIWSERITQSFESSNGTKRSSGGYLSDYANWEDWGARDIMSKTIRKAVSETIIRRGMFDSPLWSNDPVLSFIFTFTGWFFAAFNRYTIPMLQRPYDMNLITGTVATLGMGSLVDPLRAWSRGEEFKMDDDHWFAHSLSNVAPFAPLYNAAMKANALTGDRYMNDMKNDKHRSISMLGEAGGPAVGIAEVFAKTARMFASGKFNQKDFKNAMNTIPGLEMWYINDWKNQFMDSVTSGLPKSYNNAPGYGE